MIERDTIESKVKYAKGLIDNIHRRQKVDTSKAILYNSFSEALSIQIQRFGTVILRAVFTPNSNNNPYSELGVALTLLPYSLSVYAQYKITFDPSYSSSNSQAWLIYIYNADFTDTMTANISVSITSASQGVVSLTRIQ